MQPPTKSADEHAPSDVPDDSGSSENGSSAMTEDKEVAEWVNKQAKLREDGLLRVAEKPALHAVALDKVGTGSENDPSIIPRTD
jgi:mitogen-activated protein kinase kinase